MFYFGLIFILQFFLIELQGINETYIHEEKEALRYGFHQTHACQDFEKAFKCIRKCLDEKFDVAYSDKNCDCTCYTKKDKEKYRHLAMIGKGQTPPTTRIPGWAQPSSVSSNYESEDDDNKPTDTSISDIPSQQKDGNQTADGSETNKADDGGNAAAQDEKGEAATVSGDAPAENGDAPPENGDAPAENDDTPAENGDAPAEKEDAEAKKGDAEAEHAEAPAENQDAPAEQADEQAPAEK